MTLSFNLRKVDLSPAKDRIGFGSNQDSLWLAMRLNDGKNLTGLNISETGISIPVVAAAAGKSSIRTLDISSIDLSNSGEQQELVTAFAGNTTPQNLNAAKTEISDAVVKAIVANPALETLNLSECKLAETGALEDVTNALANYAGVTPSSY